MVHDKVAILPDPDPDPDPGTDRRAAPRRPSVRRPPAVAVVVYDGVALFELAVANDVFGTDVAGTSGAPLYRVAICGAAPSVTTDGGFRMEVPHGLDALEAAQTVVVLPTELSDQVPAAVLDALRLARARGRRIV